MSEESNSEHKQLLSAVYEIKKDVRGIDSRLDDLDDKWDEHITDDAAALATITAHMETFGSQLRTLTRLITEGNGQKSILAQLEHLHTEVDAVKEGMKSNTHIEPTNNAVVIAKATAETKKAKYIFWGKVVGLVVLALPGIFSLFNFHL